MSPEKIPLELYITPRELQEVPLQIGGDVAVLVQAFTQEFAMPHLQRFAKHCVIENVKPPHSFPATHISTDGPWYLPGPLVATGARIACSVQAPKTFEKSLKTSSVMAADPKKLASAAISKGIQLVPELARDGVNFSPPLISIGPNTDAALDQFKLGDEVLPKLCVLVGTASVLAMSLLADLQGVPFDPEIVKRKFSVLSAILKCLTILIMNNKLVAFHCGIISVGSVNMMVSQYFYTNKSSARRHVQVQQPHIRPKVILSKEACALLTSTQRAKSRNQGRGALQQLVCEHKEEYYALSMDEQEDLLKEYAKWTLMKATGMCTSTKSKVNNITQTLKAVENELQSLQCHTGTETILYTTHGLTDLPLRSLTFATEGVQDFMHSVMGIDNQDLVSKMEGFAVQGVKGAAKNHQQRVSETHTAIRYLINSEITGDPHTNMQWAYYFRNIVQCYQVMIEGWPDNVPFANLSQVSSALPELNRLLRKWESGATRWKTLTDEEFDKILHEHNDQLNHGEINDHRRRTRSDKGKKRKKPAATDHYSRGKKYKSVDTIEESDKENGAEEEDNEEDEARCKSPAPSPHQLPDTTTTTPMPHVPGDTHVSAPSHQLPDTTTSNTTSIPGDTHFSNDSNDLDLPPFNAASFDCDAILDRLDEIFGPADQDGMLMPTIAPSSTSLDYSTPSYDFTNFNMFSTSF
ncbi:uncharacterized protein EDB91DRAFT_1243121 [Suillus paluster]|uniref:uncharacterized protein n=1 Tax=Suillus paluster TaxID=48578 RepID=UPI001B87F5C9|nr:uncharacterized protein EDB91DRAFT_1243121 [Suillus paluster]KAG1752342.1 hypothetical protein EDB91DRAFT_1243121 [Suillus paluster]